MEFKDKLKALRKEKGLSQQALADAIFVSRSAVAKWENGLGLPGEESLAALQEYFGVGPEHFFTQEPEQVIVQKNRRIRRLNRRFVSLILTILLAAALILPNTKAGMKLTVLLLRSPLESHAQTQLADPPAEPDRLFGYEVHPHPEADAVFYDNYSWGYRGIFYSADGEPVGFQAADLPFYRCGGQWYWGEEDGDNWMHAEHITGNWYWYEMHF